MAKRKAFITGITGQDGSYLAEILLEKDYEVYGMIRRSSSFNTARIDHIFGEVELVFGDLTDGSVLNRLMRTIQPDEVYNLGAQSHVQVSFEIPEFTADTTGMGTLRLLDAIREEGVRCRFYEAGSSEMFGKVLETPQTEATPFYPRSPYGVSQVHVHVKPLSTSPDARPARGVRARRNERTACRAELPARSRREAPTFPVPIE